MFLFNSKKKRIEKAKLEYSRCLLLEYEEKIKECISVLKQSTTNADVLKNSFTALNCYLEGIANVSQRHIDNKEIKERVNKLFNDSQKIKIK
jgi:hypothetical protein